MSGISSVIIHIGAQTAQAVSEIGKVDKALGKTQSSGSKFASGIKAAAVPAAAALTAISGAAILCTKAAAENQAAQEKLEGQLKRSTGASEDAQKSTIDHTNAMADAAAVAREDVYPAMSNLVRATGSAAKSQQLLQLSLDASAATGKSVTSVSAALGKAYNGSYGALKKLVPTLSDAAIKSGNFAEVQKELNAQVGGAAKGDAETAAGQYRQMQNSMHELEVTIGDALLPALQLLLPLVTSLLETAQRHAGVFEVIAGAVAAFASAILIANGVLKVQAAWQTVMAAKTVISTAATTAYTAAQILLNIALDANPIGVVVLALAALAGALVLAWKYSGTFRQIVTEAFQLVIKYGWLLAGPLAPFALALKLAWEHSQTFRDIVTGAMDDVKQAIQDIIDLVSKVKDAIGSIHIPHIPHIPGINSAAAASGFAQPMTLAGSSGGPPLSITIQGAIDPESTAIAVRRALERYDRRRGRRPLGSS